MEERVERDNIQVVSNLLGEFEKIICVDESRKFFARDAFETIIALTKEHVIDSLGLEWQIWWRFQKLFHQRDSLLSVLEDALCANNIFIFGIIDDFNEVYKENCKSGADIVDELFQIGCSKMGVMHWILSGSSKHLRKLVMGNLLRDEDRKIYKNYSDRDLNCTKFVPLSIYPFIGASEFRNLFQFYYRGQQISHARMCQIYFSTSGFPSLVADSKLRQNIISDDTYIISSKEHRDNPILQEIFKQTIKVSKENSIYESEETALETFAEWVSFIPADIIINRFPLSELYELADRGLIRYIPQKPAKVSLGSAVIFKDLLWADDDDSTPTVEEIIALSTANNQQGNATDCDLARDCCLRYIGMAAAKIDAVKVFGFSLEIPSCVSHTPTMMQPIPKLHVGQRINDTFDSIKDRVHKECLGDDCDGLGFDGVVITGSDVKAIAYRIQVKIRHSGEFKLPDLQKIVNMMKNMTATALDAYKATGLTTNADLAPTSMQYLKSEDIFVWDKKFLGEHVWPVSVQALGKRFRA
eukprot:gene35981-46732_t